MKEYGEKTGAKIFFVAISLPMLILSGWVIIGGETFITSLMGVGMLLLFLYTGINPLVHKITLGDGFIAERSLLGKKRILFEDITQLVAQFNMAQIKSARAKIEIPRYVIKDSDEIMGAVLSKVKNNDRVLYAGDPIIFQTFVNEFGDESTPATARESSLMDFTFIDSAELIEKKWGFRAVKLSTSKGDFKITYLGSNLGYECVFVNDELVSKQDSLFWYTPKFDFTVEGMRISVNVRVYPWFTMRKFWIEVNDRIVYSE